MKYLYIVLIALLFTSCSIGKKINKVNTTEKKKETVVDKSVTKITEVEKVDTLLTGDTTTVEKDITEAEVTLIDNEHNKVTASKDKYTGKIKTTIINKPRKIQIEKTKVTEIQNNITVESKTKTNIKTADKDIEKKSLFSLPWWIWLIIAGIILLFILWKRR